MFEIPTPDVLPDETIPFLPCPFTRENEKRFMNPVRYSTNHILLPVYIAFSVLCLGVGIVLMSLDENRFTWLFILCMAVFAVISAVVLYQVPQTRKKEVAIELSRYDFDVENFEKRECYDAQNEIWEVVLTQTGLYVEGKHYYYSSLSPTLVTSNHFNRIWVSIRFGDDPWHGVYVPLNGSIIRAVEEFDIPITNREKIKYLIEHKENAFAQIYNSGTFNIYSYE